MHSTTTPQPPKCEASGGVKANSEDQGREGRTMSYILIGTMPDDAWPTFCEWLDCQPPAAIGGRVEEAHFMLADANLYLLEGRYSPHVVLALRQLASLANLMYRTAKERYNLDTTPCPKCSYLETPS